MKQIDSNKTPPLQLFATEFKDLFEIKANPALDSRGSFSRIFCADLFKDFGLANRILQCNLSDNIRAGTIRGLHYQKAPFGEEKIVHCLSGSIFDVVLDIRPTSATFGQWKCFQMSPSVTPTIYIGKGFAHGFQTLEADTKVIYLMTEIYHPSSARGVKWDDPGLAIPWPIRENITISAIDLSHPLFMQCEFY